MCRGSWAACTARQSARRTHSGHSELEPPFGPPDCSPWHASRAQEIAYAAAWVAPAPGRACSLVLSAPSRCRGAAASLRRSSGRPTPASEAPRARALQPLAVPVRLRQGSRPRRNTQCPTVEHRRPGCLARMQTRQRASATLPSLGVAARLVASWSAARISGAVGRINFGGKASGEATT